MQKRLIVLLTLVAVILLLSVGCTKITTPDESPVSSGRSVSSLEKLIGSAKVSSGRSDGAIDDVVTRWADVYFEAKVFLAQIEGKKVDLKQIQEERADYIKQLHEKVERDPTVLEFMEYVLKTDAEIKKKIGYETLKQKCLKGEISLDEIRLAYRKAEEEMGVYEYVIKGFENPVRRFKRAGKAGVRFKILTEEGPHHDELSHLRRGDVCAGGWESSSSSSDFSFGHAAIWCMVGDRHPDNPKSKVAMSAWKKPWEGYSDLHEPDYEVGYDFRRCWDGTGIDSPVHLMRVYDGGAPTPDWKASTAASWAEAQRGKQYFFDFTNGKSTTDDFYCSLLVWHAWKRQGIDLDSWDNPLTDGIFNFVVFPYDIYLDNNTRVLYSY